MRGDYRVKVHPTSVSNSACHRIAAVGHRGRGRCRNHRFGDDGVRFESARCSAVRLDLARCRWRPSDIDKRTAVSRSPGVFRRRGLDSHQSAVALLSPLSVAA